MLKKVVKILLIFIVICGILIGLTACGEEKTEKVVKKVEEADSSKSFLIEYDDVDVTPGAIFDESKISKTANVSEIPSCAFDGVDKVYTYPEVEITVAEINGKSTVYSVYFIDETITTGEGVKISDSKDLMIEKYGKDYDNSLNNKFDYNKGNVTLSFVIENDIITGIEYTLITK